jgi:hypothetical protein
MRVRRTACWAQLAVVLAFVEAAQFVAASQAESNDKEQNGGCTMLHRASKWGVLVVVRSMVEAGADKDEKDEAGNTPLHWAAASDRRRSEAHRSCVTEPLVWIPTDSPPQGTIRSPHAPLQGKDALRTGMRRA